MSQKVLNKVNNDIFSYDTTGGVFKMSRVMPTEIHHSTGGVGTANYVLTSTGSGWNWSNSLNVHSITASNYLVGSRTIVSASAQGNFADLEIKNNYGTKLLIEGDTGNIDCSGTLSIDNISEKTTNAGVNISSVNIKGQDITNVNSITASNYKVGSRTIVSASAQGNFADLEIKNNYGTKLLIEGDTGNIDCSGTLSIDNISEKTTGNGVTISSIHINNELHVWNEDTPASYSNGSSGDVLTSQGTGKPPKWEPLPTGGGGGTVITGTSLKSNLTGTNVNTNNGISLGANAGNSGQGQQAIAIGHNAGQTSQALHTVALGINAGNSNQGGGAVAIGFNAGQTTQGGNTVAIGNGAGKSSQVGGAVAIGLNAGATTQGGNSVAIGIQAGNSGQLSNAVAIGLNAGYTTQGAAAVAIGAFAAEFSQGTNSVAIGRSAGYYGGSHSNTIVINATGTALWPAGQERTYIKPIRQATATEILYYDEPSGEVTRGPASTLTQRPYAEFVITSGSNIYMPGYGSDIVYSSSVLSNQITLDSNKINFTVTHSGVYTIFTSFRSDGPDSWSYMRLLDNNNTEIAHSEGVGFRVSGMPSYSIMANLTAGTLYKINLYILNSNPGLAIYSPSVGYQLVTLITYL